MLEPEAKAGTFALALSACAAITVFALSIAGDCDNKKSCDPEKCDSPPPVPPPPTSTIYLASQADVDDLPPTDSIKALLGVNAGPLPVRGGPDLTAGYAEIGVNAVRTHEFYDVFDVSAVYPDRTVDPSKAELEPFDWDATEDAFQALTDLGYGPLFRLGESTGGPAPPSAADPQRKHWDAAIPLVLAHLAVGLPEGYAMRSLEVWDEPDGSPPWPDGIAEFAEFFANVVWIVNEGLDGVAVGGPAFSDDAIESGAVVTFVDSYNKYVKEHPDALGDLRFDFTTWHTFSSDPDDYIQAAQTYYELFVDDPAVPPDLEHDFDYALDLTPHLMVTAWNLAPEDQVLLDDPAGAALLTACWIAMQGDDDTVGTGAGDDEEFRIEQAYFYKGVDDDDAGDRGLYTAEGLPKVAARTFGLWSEFVAEHGEQRFFTSSEIVFPDPGGPPTRPFSNGLWCITGRGDGGVGMLIANLGEVKRWELYRLGIVDAERLSVTQFREDGTLETFTPASREVEIGERRMMLVKVADG